MAANLNSYGWECKLSVGKEWVIINYCVWREGKRTTLLQTSRQSSLYSRYLKRKELCNYVKMQKNACKREKEEELVQPQRSSLPFKCLPWGWNLHRYHLPCEIKWVILSISQKIMEWKQSQGLLAWKQCKTHMESHEDNCSHCKTQSKWTKDHVIDKLQDAHT